MNIELVPVDPYCPMHVAVLYDLLKERQPWQSISHKRMPTWDEHVDFVQSRPYKGWYLIQQNGCMIGSTYFSKQNEIGIFLYASQTGKGIAKYAVAKLMGMHEGPYYANMNPNNGASAAFFEKLGFKLIQVTYHAE